jgi:hypothetical protein
MVYDDVRDGQMSNSYSQSASNTWVIIPQTLLTHQKRKKEKKKKEKEKIGSSRDHPNPTLVGNCNIEYFNIE